MILVLVIAAIALGIFYVILQADISGTLKFLLVVVEMLAVSQIYIRKYKLPSELGMVLLKSDKGIEPIERLAKNAEVFNFFADVGTSISYGLLGAFLMKKNTSVLTMLLGLILAFFLTWLVAPISIGYLISVAKIDIVSKTAVPVGVDPWLTFIMAGALILAGGLFLLMLFGIATKGVEVLGAILGTATTGVNTLANTDAGGTFLLPGINLPFIEGIIALAIVLVVHEGAHAVLTRIAKVPLISSGIVLFGIIPMGAFVEPDEKKLERVEQSRQTRVLVAGPSANMFMATILFMVFIAFFALTAQFREEGFLVLSGMEPNTVIYAMNGQPVDLEADLANYTGTDLPENSVVALQTNKGEILRETDDKGSMGIRFTVLTKSSLFAVYSIPGLGFIYAILGLSLALNFLVGAVNILPVPLFDGYRIINANIKNKNVVNMISYGALFLFILNFLPLLFR